MSLRLDCVNLLLTYNDPEGKIFGDMSLLDQLIENFKEYEPIYGVSCKEKAPTTGMTHYHVYIKLKKRCQKKDGRSLLIVETIRPNIESVRNNIKAVIKYVKKGGYYAEYGTCPINLKEEKNNKVKKAQMMMTGNLEELFLNGELGAVDVIRAQKLKTIFQLAKPIEKYSKKLVLWFKGETGEGKTRKAIEIAEMFNLSFWMTNDSLKWYDGYTGQELVIIDDFRKNMLGDWNYLLRLLDGYGLAVQVKGGFTTWKPKIIIITSPATPHEAFSWVNKEGEEQGWDKEEQLIRRLTHENEEQIYQFPLWKEEEKKLEATIRKFLGLPEEEFLPSEEWSIIEPEGFITPN